MTAATQDAWHFYLDMKIQVFYLLELLVFVLVLSPAAARFRKHCYIVTVRTPCIQSNSLETCTIMPFQIISWHSHCHLKPRSNRSSALQQHLNVAGISIARPLQPRRTLRARAGRSTSADVNQAYDEKLFVGELLRQASTLKEYEHLLQAAADKQHSQPSGSPAHNGSLGAGTTEVLPPPADGDVRSNGQSLGAPEEHLQSKGRGGPGPGGPDSPGSTDGAASNGFDETADEETDNSENPEAKSSGSTPAAPDPAHPGASGHQQRSGPDAATPEDDGAGTGDPLA